MLLIGHTASMVFPLEGIIYVNWHTVEHLPVKQPPTPRVGPDKPLQRKPGQTPGYPRAKFWVRVRLGHCSCPL